MSDDFDSQSLNHHCRERKSNRKPKPKRKSQNLSFAEDATNKKDTSTYSKLPPAIPELESHPNNVNLLSTILKFMNQDGVNGPLLRTTVAKVKITESIDEKYCTILEKYGV
ncbi:hypothetical protein CDAR_621071 [Caerostris darwini]|uniref:Uncharacterized protein n=1 Tax=Caerostris darwini TaxID=1538125 RepID=A0AAV4THL7_9ARAC|nr:hypothetical protein CDAR_621071 [Caerostris darwini]